MLVDARLSDTLLHRLQSTEIITCRISPWQVLLLCDGQHSCRWVLREVTSTIVNSECHLAVAGEKPINVVQPQGPSFEVNGNEISWLNWNMRISFNHREGLVFHNVG